MRCEEITELLSGYIDGVLDERQKAELQEHMESCESCRLQMEALKETVALVGNLPDLEPPTDLLDRIHAELDEQEEEPETRPQGVIWALFRGPQAQVALAASIVLAVGIFALKQAQRGELETLQALPPAPEAEESEESQEMEQTRDSKREMAPVDAVKMKAQDKYSRDKIMPTPAAPVLKSSVARPEATLGEPTERRGAARMTKAPRSAQIGGSAEAPAREDSETSGRIWRQEGKGKERARLQADFGMAEAAAAVPVPVDEDVAAPTAEGDVYTDGAVLAKPVMLARKAPAPDMVLTVTEKNRAALVQALSRADQKRTQAKPAELREKKVLRAAEMNDAVADVATARELAVEEQEEAQTEFVVTIRASEYDSFLESLKNFGAVASFARNEDAKAGGKKDSNARIELRIRIVVAELKKTN